MHMMHTVQSVDEACVAFKDVFCTAFEAFMVSHGPRFGDGAYHIVIMAGFILACVLYLAHMPWPWLASFSMIC